jgi:Helicase HerA, central domain
MADLVIGGAIDPASHQRTDQPIRLASGDLTTHGVIVGMTGSGKTGLGVVLVEEVLSAGIPALLIDPKGDLTNLCLTFPGLSAAEFEPWVNEGDAAKADTTVPEFAARQATAWTDGLAGWGLGPERIGALRAATEMTIYTPGSTGGVGLNIVGSLAAPGTDDAETLNDEIDGFVSGLLAMVGIEADPLSSREHILLSNLILNEWTAGRSLDLAILVGMVQRPPLRKLGVLELDQFYPERDRRGLAMKLNGLLASTSFAAWMSGPPLDIDAMLHTADGRPRCAIVTTAHLSDEERQFVTTLVLSKLVTWMRRQSGTTDLRALLYMDEVAGYLPPTANPATKRPIMLLMKQARAFGLGVVLSTQNPVDVDYKALSNAGTWMVGRLQTERDKSRLLDGMSAASGGVDLGAVGDTITGLGKREFLLRRAGKDQPEVFTTRWAMSYLRGPLTRAQIATLMAEQKSALPAPATPAVIPPAGDAYAPPSGPAMNAPAPGSSASPPTVALPTGGADDTQVAPEVAAGVAVRFVDPAAPWLSSIGGDPRGARLQAAAMARVALRYDEEKADLVHDEEFEAVIFPLGEPIDVTRAISVDYDDRDLRETGPQAALFRLPGPSVKTKTTWSRVERDLVDHLVRSRSIEIPTSRPLKLYGRPGESANEFAARCAVAADSRADEETAALRDKYAAKVDKLRTQIAAAEDKAELLETQRSGRRNEEMLSTAGSILGGLLGGRTSRKGMLGSVFGTAGSAAGRRSRTAAAGDRLEAAENRLNELHRQLADLEAQAEAEVVAIDARWGAVAADVATVRVDLERTDVKVTQLLLAWVPVT